MTTAYPGEVCDLNSYAVGCDVTNLTATACRCYQTEPEDVSSGYDSLATENTLLNNTNIDSQSMNNSNTTSIPMQTIETDFQGICEG